MPGGVNAELKTRERTADKRKARKKTEPIKRGEVESEDDASTTFD